MSILIVICFRVMAVLPTQLHAPMDAAWRAYSLYSLHDGRGMSCLCLASCVHLHLSSRTEARAYDTNGPKATLLGSQNS